MEAEVYGSAKARFFKKLGSGYVLKAYRYISNFFKKNLELKIILFKIKNYSFIIILK